MAGRNGRSQRAARRARERQEAGPRARRASSDGADSGSGWPLIAGVAGIVVAAIVLGAVALGGGSSGSGVTTTEGAARLATALEHSGGSTITVYRGNAHTVMHADAPLPTASVPRSDGRPTLVWFSGTWCHFCERMEPFAYETVAQLTDQVVFMEKSVDHDRGAAARYGVRGTPTFVLIDGRGEELARFFYQDNRVAFAAAIQEALAALS